MIVRSVLGALAIFGLLAGLLIALVIVGSGAGHQVNALEWSVQVLVLVSALFMLASRMRRRS